MIEALKLHYGYQFEEALLKEINDVGVFREVPQDSVMLNIGEYIRSMPLILEGAVKIMREDPEGDELLLYFIEQGDTCAMTITCCMGQTKSEIRAVAETDTKVIMVPVAKMTEWLHKYKSWQNFILNSYHERMHELLEAIDTIAFMRMDERLLKYLRDRAMVTHNDELRTTHKDIANDLHTSRVVVSRLLKRFEQQGLIDIHRNQIKILEI